MIDPSIRHKHLIIRANVNDALIDDDRADEWLRKLVEEIDMEILMGPFSKYHEMVGNRGRTALIGITTSSITCHVWDEVTPALMELDVYSCKEFDIDKVFGMLRELGSSNVKYKFIDREHDLIELESGSI